MGAEDRVRGVLLAGLTVAALALGGWWWREAAPDFGPVVPTPSPSLVEPTDQPLGQVVYIDPATGQVVDGPETGLEDTVILHQAPDAPGPAERTIWVDRSHLGADDDPLVRQAQAASGERYLLTLACTGPGQLAVEHFGAREEGSEAVIPCSASPTAVTLTASGGPLLVRFTASIGEIDLDARLTSLS
ncbi:hypothetical protein [Micromonospora sp. SL4-19]|uniref:hypothetical protein n=1 Tax=Micromonospora sp. SL4-19 TaxID=3399129 RepID=UPI003A4D450E